MKKLFVLIISSLLCFSCNQDPQKGDHQIEWFDWDGVKLAWDFLRYPLLWDIFVFNDLNTGLDKLFENFNGIEELFKRDASFALLKRYSLMIQNFKFLDGESSELEKGNFIISVSALEVLLSRYHSQGLEIETFRLLLKNLVDGYKAKCDYSDLFQGFGFDTNYFTRAQMIIKICEQCLEEIPQGEKKSVFSGRPDKETKDVINELFYKIIL